jgi:hypothetical protein
MADEPFVSSWKEVGAKQRDNNGAAPEGHGLLFWDRHPGDAAPSFSFSYSFSFSPFSLHSAAVQTALTTDSPDLHGYRNNSVSKSGSNPLNGGVIARNFVFD